MSAHPYDKFWSSVENLILSTPGTKGHRRATEYAIERFIKLDNSDKALAFTRLSQKSKASLAPADAMYLALQAKLVEHLPEGATKAEASVPRLEVPKGTYREGERYRATFTKVGNQWHYSIEDNQGQVFVASTVPTLGGAVRLTEAPLVTNEEKVRTEREHPDKDVVGFELRDPDGDLIGESGIVSTDPNVCLKAVIHLLGIPYTDEVRSSLEGQDKFGYSNAWADEMTTPVIATVVIQSGVATWDKEEGKYVWDQTGDTLYNLSVTPAGVDRAF